MGGKSKSVTVGYRYFMGVHMVVCQGVVDTINKIVVGEKLAYDAPIASVFDNPVITHNGFIKEPVSVPIAYDSINWNSLCLTINAIRPKIDRINTSGLINTSYIFTGSQSIVKDLVVSTNSATFLLTSTVDIDSPFGNIFYVEVTMVAQRVGVATTFSATSARRRPNSTSPFTTVPIAVNASDIFNLSAVSVDSLKVSSQPVQTIFVDKPNLFGGEEREGGVKGEVDVLFGVKGQGQNAYLKLHQGSDTPANIGFTSLVFKSFYWAAMNPYFKPVWIEATRIFKGWSIGSAWYPEKAVIPDAVFNGQQVKDMNPAHIIYQCLTDSRWGLGYSVDDVDDLSFKAAADALHNLSFGLSLMWDNQSSLEAFIQDILGHINGTLLILRDTGKFALRLTGYTSYNYPYEPLERPIVNKYNCRVKSFQRSVLGELPNEMVVTYRDRLGNNRSVAVQNNASIDAQGSVVSATKDFVGIRNPNLAFSVAKRELRMVSEPLAKLEILVDYSFSQLTKGDYVDVRIPSLNIYENFIVIDMTIGGEEDGAIALTLLEDLAGGGAADGLKNNTPLFYDPYNGLTGGGDAAVPVQAFKVFEAPYWFVFFQHSRAELAFLTPEYGFAMCIASKSVADTITLTYDLYASPTISGDYTSLSTGDFCPSGTLKFAVNKMVTTMTIEAFSNLEDVETESEGGYVLIGDEILALTNINVLTGVATVRRGCLDTLPLNHPAGTRVFFERGVSAYDPTEHVSGEVTYYKVAGNTTDSTFNLLSISAFPLSFQNRAGRPYPPAKLRINTLAYPATVTGGFTVTWAHRNRLSQTVEFVDNTVDSITPEVGTTYNVRLFRITTGAPLLQEYLNVVGTSQAISGSMSAGTLRIEVETVVTTTTVVTGQPDVVTTVKSLYSHSHEFTFTP